MKVRSRAGPGGALPAILVVGLCVHACGTDDSGRKGTGTETGNPVETTTAGLQIVDTSTAADWATLADTGRPGGPVAVEAFHAAVASWALLDAETGASAGTAALTRALDGEDGEDAEGEDAEHAEDESGEDSGADDDDDADDDGGEDAQAAAGAAKAKGKSAAKGKKAREVLDQLAGEGVLDPGAKAKGTTLAEPGKHGKLPGAAKCRNGKAYGLRLQLAAAIDGEVLEGAEAGTGAVVLVLTRVGQTMTVVAGGDLTLAALPGKHKGLLCGNKKGLGVNLVAGVRVAALAAAITPEHWDAGVAGDLFAGPETAAAAAAAAALGGAVTVWSDTNGNAAPDPGETELPLTPSGS